MAKAKSLVEQGVDVVEERMQQYGPPLDNFRDIAIMWSVMLGIGISPVDVVHCMIALKMCREKYKHSDDNLIDIAGYTHIAEIFERSPVAYEPGVMFNKDKEQDATRHMLHGGLLLKKPLAAHSVTCPDSFQVVTHPIVVAGRAYRIIYRAVTNGAELIPETAITYHNEGEDE